MSKGIKKYAMTVYKVHFYGAIIKMYFFLNVIKLLRTRLNNVSERRKSTCAQYDFISMFLVIEFGQKSKCKGIRATRSVNVFDYHALINYYTILIFIVFVSFISHFYQLTNMFKNTKQKTNYCQQH